MIPANACFLSVNGGSSSIKFSLYRSDAQTRIVDGRINVSAADHPAAIKSFLEWLRGRSELPLIAGVGHRVVHGGPTYSEPTRVTPAVIAALRELSPFDSEHLPDEIRLIEALQRELPAVPQIACFDTAFHQRMPRVARVLPIPRRFEARGIRRYGFHGLSYAYLMQQLAQLAGPRVANGRTVLAHLGNGASMAAVRDGRGIDTTMAFTPTAGLVMGSRCGDLDPGVVAYLYRTEGMSVARIDHMLNHESGLLGVSQTSSDVKTLLADEVNDVRAAEALELFCYQARKWLGAYSAALGGLDTVVFSGGIGEHSAVIRSRICAGLGFLGIEIDEAHNVAHRPIISVDGGKVTVRVIPTNEELMIAQAVKLLLESPQGIP